MTHYLPEPDGSNATKVVLAYPPVVQRTNSQNIPYYDERNVAVPGESGFLSTNGGVYLPQGVSLVLPKGTRARGAARVISVEKLAPAIPGPRPRPSGHPVVTITEPKETITARSMIQLKGTSDQPLRSIRFDITNDAGRSLDRQGFVTDTYFDTAYWKETTNYFECFDIDLARGTNTITVRCMDLAGQRITNNLVYIMRPDPNTKPPTISLQWPNPEGEICGDYFTVRGRIDDFDASIAGRIACNGRTNLVKGLVERNGRFWLEPLPLLGKTNLLTILTMNSAGKASATNLTFIKSDTALTINPIPVDQLWQLQVTVTGQVRPANQLVWVNGLAADVKADGSWSVTGIPMNREGVAIFEATSACFEATVSSIKAEVPAAPNAVPQRSVSVSAVLASEPITLNASQPTYGTFNLHLTGTAGKNFILCASTNLADWTPILTNRESGPTFDYTETNVTAYGCRFFRTIPTNP